MNKVKDIIFLVIFLAVATAGVMSFIGSVKDISEPIGDADQEMSYSGIATTTLSIKDTEVEALVADTSAERRQGLSGRMYLPPGTGMFFVFDEQRRVGIWMKDMLFSIDIIWIDEQFRVVHIVEHAPPESFPEVFSPSVPALYVLEVPAGFVAEQKVVLGDFVTVFNRQ